MNKVNPLDRFVSCPKCGAKTEKEAETTCQPSGDDCPMTCEDDWDTALERLNNEAEAYEKMAQEQYEFEMRKYYERQMEEQAYMAEINERDL